MYLRWHIGPTGRVFHYLFYYLFYITYMWYVITHVSKLNYLLLTYLCFDFSNFPEVQKERESKYRSRWEWTGSFAQYSIEVICSCIYRTKKKPSKSAICYKTLHFVIIWHVSAFGFEFYHWIRLTCTMYLMYLNVEIFNYLYYRKFYGILCHRKKGYKEDIYKESTFGTVLSNCSAS